ncbi:hypothetical protein OE810_12965 [Rhodobacteraceae bacterium XHP0102]|nr:hypothetical protein [Rhodobacteraceae bacterium XHP0102]
MALLSVLTKFGADRAAHDPHMEAMAGLPQAAFAALACLALRAGGK